MLIAVYAIFALSATARAAVQIATKFAEAPLAYLLSALAGVVYIVATVALARGMRALAWAAVGFELLGVLTVGLASDMLRYGPRVRGIVPAAAEVTARDA